MIQTIQIIVGSAGIVSLLIAGFFLVRRFVAQSRQEKKIKEEQRNGARYALEIFQPMHWEALHFAILSQEFRRNGSEKTELIKSFPNISSCHHQLRSHIQQATDNLKVIELTNLTN